MFVAISTCATKSRAFVPRRKKKRVFRPHDCTLRDLRELSVETGISVDEVMSRLDDFLAADALLGSGAPLSEAVFTAAKQTAARLFPKAEPSVFAPEAAPAAETVAPAPDLVAEAAELVVEEAELVAEEREILAESAALFEAPEIMKEPPAPPVFERTESVSPEPVEIVPEPMTAFEMPAPEIETPAEAGPGPEPVAVSPDTVVEPLVEEAPAALRKEAPRPVETGFVIIEAEPAEAETKKTASGTVNQAAPVPAKPAPEEARPKLWPARKPSKFAHQELEKLRRLSTVRVETAEPEDDTEDEPLIDMTVPEDYVVATTTESVVWPWETHPDLTLKEALEALDDRLLASLTEEVVSCTISGSLGNGGIRSLCNTYQKDMEKIYTELQRESRRRITRMSTRKPSSASAGEMDSTQEMAMRMAKKFLQTEMCNKPMRFQSPFPDENGNYYIIQSHRIEDEDSVEFPNERTYYREVGNGWAISVGY